MSFKFFPESDPTAESLSNDKSVEQVVAKQIIINDIHYALFSKLKLTRSAITELKSPRLKCVNISELVNVDSLVTDNSVVDLLKSTSDLKSGVYEGGFKTWECTFDLINYIRDNLVEILPDTDKPLKVLDLGCGSGFLGLFMLSLAKAKNIDVRVDFQDYNSEVIDYITVPNALLNFSEEDILACRFFSGDWTSFGEMIESENTHYDLILSSETIYNLDYFPKFLGVIKKTLRNGGMTSLYLAAKTFYFGVGGGTKTFLNMLEKDGELEGETVQVFKDGVKREILRVRRKLP